jgi:hypothetical protein
MLAEASASVLAQTIYPVPHLIVVDEEYAGPGPTLNKLISQVETEWYAVLNDDDLFDPDHLEICLSQGGHADIILSWGRHEGNPDIPYRGRFSLVDWYEKNDTGMRGGCYIARKKVWEESPYRDELVEDWNFIRRAAWRGYRIHPVYKETWTYRFHNSNTSLIYDAALSGKDLPDNLHHLGKWIPGSA